MGEEITCCFTGHRPHRLPWHEDELDPRCQRFRAELDRQVAMAYDRGYRHFISGMAQGGDPVSYTHLDVYKRQPHRCHRRRSGRGQYAAALQEAGGAGRQ